jgi:hypothetical protein
MRAQIVRPLKMAGMAALVIIAALILGLAWLNWASSKRLQVVARAVDHMQEMQGLGLTMTQLLADDLTGVSTITLGHISMVSSDIRGLINPALNLHSETPGLLERTLASSRRRGYYPGLLQQRR